MIRKIVTLSAFIALFAAFYPQQAQAQQSCYALLPEEVRTVDMDGDKLHLSLDGNAFAAFLSYTAVHQQQCVTIGGNVFSVNAVKDRGLSLLPQTESEDIRHFLGTAF
ncbi:MAG: hypothetical protein EP349_10360 [Alphaproteobacteria bacterium]|nr:MAG: hypothetical protein EP349_10360 [Alphaproteobacteria bacterium]